MTSPGYHAAEDGSLARSTGGAAARGAMLIALALVIGLLLILFALDDPQTEVVADAPDESEQVDVDEGDDLPDPGETPGPELVDPGEGDVVEPPATIPTIDDGIVVDPPIEGQILPNNEVNVLVANGTGGSGVAGGVRDILNADGYTAVVSNAPATAEGVIFYKPGFSENAIAIGVALGAAPDVVVMAPVDGQIGVAADAIADGRLDTANVVVIIGTDGAVPSS